MNTLPPQQLARARALADAGHRTEAILSYRAHLDACPRHAEAWYEYAWLLRRQGEPEQALTAYANALSLGIGKAEEVYLNRAVIFSDDLRNAEHAMRELLHALKLRPGYPPALFNLGKLQEDQGELDEAIATYEQLSTSSVDPELALEGLARLVQIDLPHQAHPHRLQRLIVEAERKTHAKELRASLWFALGRCREFAGTFESAFSAFTSANALLSNNGPAYKPLRVQDHVDAILASHRAMQPPEDSLRSPATPPEPLFICGMFRSGSTLLEQVLNGHPEIIAGGELAYFPRLSAGPLGKHATGLRMPEPIAEQVAQTYLSLLQRVTEQSSSCPTYVTDKRPDNILLLPLIRQVFPRARIIITTRDPMDTGLSVFQQHLNPMQAPYSSSLEGIAHYQAQVHRLTESAKTAWGADVYLFDYDAFVRVPEGQLSALLAWLGLPWSDSCMRFHEQRNPVGTASHAQVRRPLYQQSSGRWLSYESQLSPLREALVRFGYPLVN